MYENETASAVNHKLSHMNAGHGGSLATGSASIARDASPRDRTAADDLQQMLGALREMQINNTRRMIELGARAFGGSPVGKNATVASSQGERPSRPGWSSSSRCKSKICCSLPRCRPKPSPTPKD